MTGGVGFEPITEALLPEVHAINQENAAELSSLTTPELAELVAMSACAVAGLEAGRVVGFLLAFDERAPYASPNYRWFLERYDRFIYVDRIVVSAAQRGRAVGRSLYAHAIEFARDRGKGRLCCEVNVVPENRASLRFHEALRFRPCGRRVYPDGRREVLMHTLDVE